MKAFWSLRRTSSFLITAVKLSWKYEACKFIACFSYFSNHDFKISTVLMYALYTMQILLSDFMILIQLKLYKLAMYQIFWPL